jgi:uncharacterized coiled-coil DUF342 family protein
VGEEGHEARISVLEAYAAQLREDVRELREELRAMRAKDGAIAEVVRQIRSDVQAVDHRADRLDDKAAAIRADVGDLRDDAKANALTAQGNKVEIGKWVALAGGVGLAVSTVVNAIGLWSKLAG